MGLLERLTLPDDNNSPLSRALLMRGPAREDPSAEDERTGNEDVRSGAHEKTSESQSVDTGAAVRALLKEIHGKHDPGIVSPSHLFSILHRHLHVTSGTILVQEPGKDAYSPMATVGLDSTSRFRLRIPGATIQKICRRVGAVTLEGIDRDLLKPFLSAGEFSRRNRIAALPFFYNREILAVLLVFDSPLLELDLDVLDVLLAAFSERAGYLLFDGRQKPFSAAKRVTVLDKVHAPHVIARLKERAAGTNQDLVLLHVSLLPIYETIRQAHPHMDPSYLLNDLLGTCALLCADYYTLLHQGSGDFVLAGLANPHLDAELLLHLLGNTLQQLFGIVPVTPLTHKPLDAEQFLREI
ncbi:MAG: hypothetical protein EA427_08325 [Spirochaetaceae bacterium]|nr:MAG: hypothetical protein EA427_08325 [Spirochaetaceae bacterium]